MAQVQIGDDFGRITEINQHMEECSSEIIVVAEPPLNQCPNPSLTANPSLPGDKKSTSSPP